jgi:hypothetical protein
MRIYPVLVMVAPRGGSPAETWMGDARQAAGLDLCARLTQVEGVRVFVDAPDSRDRVAFAELDVQLVPPLEEPFHFGRRLSQICQDHRWTQAAYFGAASAPLLSSDTLSEVFEQARSLPAEAGIVNNLHSSDWLVLNQTKALGTLADRLPKDNMLGWILSHDAGYRILPKPPETQFRADLDTPADVFMVGGHPHSGDQLGAFASAADENLKQRIDRLKASLIVPGDSIALIGRASSHVWARLESELPIWVRSYVEERGMVASGRLAEGRVRSLVAEAIERWGPEDFIRLIGEMAQAVVWDTRVWMGHRGPWPGESDRWASDLGWLDQVKDPSLRDLTQAVLASPIPIVTGGQGVVGGSLMALLDGV